MYKRQVWYLELDLDGLPSTDAAGSERRWFVGTICHAAGLLRTMAAAAEGHWDRPLLILFIAARANTCLV